MTLHVTFGLNRARELKAIVFAESARSGVPNHCQIDIYIYIIYFMSQNLLLDCDGLWDMDLNVVCSSVQTLSNSWHLIWTIRKA